MIHKYINSKPGCSPKQPIVQVFSKSEMCEVGPEYCGRPFGGVCIIAKKHHLYKIHEIEVPSERGVAIGLCSNAGVLVQVIVAVYMPFYDSSNKMQTVWFTETVDILQTLYDNYAALAPVKLFGEFNARLPG